MVLGWNGSAFQSRLAQASRTAFSNGSALARSTVPPILIQAAYLELITGLLYQTARQSQKV